MLIKQLVGGLTGRVHGRWFCRQSSNYQLIAGVCVERLPTLAPELNLIEHSLKDAFLKHEVVRSLYSEHERRHFEDL